MAVSTVKDATTICPSFGKKSLCPTVAADVYKNDLSIGRARSQGFFENGSHIV